MRRGKENNNMSQSRSSTNARTGKQAESVSPNGTVTVNSPHSHKSAVTEEETLSDTPLPLKQKNK